MYRLVAEVDASGFAGLAESVFEAGEVHGDLTGLSIGVASAADRHSLHWRVTWRVRKRLGMAVGMERRSVWGQKPGSGD